VSLQVEILEQSFDLVAPCGDALVERFYQRVFDVNPELQELFASTDMATQKRILLSTLVLLRKSLRDLGAIVPALQSLGVKHAGFGVRPEDYAAIGVALLGTMAELGGAEWRPEYSAAWAEAYGVVQATMLSGAAA
jgi:hemoglobin-like flavoprotein